MKNRFRKLCGILLAAAMLIGGIRPFRIAAKAAGQENVLSQTANSVTIGIETTYKCGLFITSDMSKETYATVGYAGDMTNVNGYAQWTITNVPVREGAGFTATPLSYGDQFRYWIRVEDPSGQYIAGPYNYVHDVQGGTENPGENPSEGSSEEPTGGWDPGEIIHPEGPADTGEDGNSPAVSLSYSIPQIDASMHSDDSFTYFVVSNNTSGKFSDDQVFLTVIGRAWNDNAEEPFAYLQANGTLAPIASRSNDRTKTMYNPASGLYDTVRSFANLGFSIADLKALGQVDGNGNAYVKVPPIRSGRMFVSYGEDICITINAGGYAGPDLVNPTDPNQGITFDFVEFSTNTIGEFWGNTTRVDGYVFPISLRLTGTVDVTDANGLPVYENGQVKQQAHDVWVGDLGTLEEIYARWDYDTRAGSQFEKFNHLLVRDRFGKPERIMAPGKGEFDKNGNGIYTDYYTEYVNYVWNMYSNPFNPSNPMVFTTQGGRFVQTGTAGSAPGCNADSYALKDGSPLLVFKHEVWDQGSQSWTEAFPGRRYYIHKPNTGEVLEGKGAFDHHHEQGFGTDTSDLVIESQLCAAFNRGVAHINEDINQIYSTNPNDPTGVYSNGNPIAPWGNVASYYKTDSVNKGVFNFYAMFWHKFGAEGKAYGYCYDDVWEQSTLLYARHANVLSMDFYSYGRTNSGEVVTPTDPSDPSVEPGDPSEEPSDSNGLLKDTALTNAAGNWYGTEGIVSFNGNGSATANIGGVGAGDQNWQYQIKQSGLTLTQGKWYKASFTAESSIARTIQLLLQQNERGWAVYGEKKYDLAANQAADCDLIFQMTADTDTDVLYGIMLGNVAGALSAHTVKISNVALEEYDSEPKEEEPADPQPPVEEKELPFRDVAKGSWYYDAVKEVYELGIMTGNSAGTLFTPDGVMTRGMIVNVLYRLDGSPKTTYQAGFKDVDARKYYATSVNWAVQNGIVKGYSDNTFRPDDEITREQMVIILYYYAKYLGMDVSKTADLSGYKDSAKVHSYAAAPVKWAVAEGIMSGSSSKQLNPLQTVTRAQAARMLAEFNHLKVAAGK